MYFGSVRFFKNLILLTVIIFIAVPSFFAFRYHNAVVLQQETLTQLEEEVSRLNQDLETAVKEVQSRQIPEPVEPIDEQPVFSAEVPAYQSLYPDFYAPQPLDASERIEGTIHLTFDDGPSPRTDEILEILAQQDVKATFFVTGQADEANRQRMRKIVEQGHSIGMHTYSHNYTKIYESVEAFLDDMYQVFTLIREATGVTPTFFRFPGGSINAYNAHLYQELIAEMLRRGFVPHDWNLSSEDATGSKISPEQIVHNVVTGATRVNRGVVLMHDTTSKNSTVAALNGMIEQLRSMGFDFQAITAATKPTLFGYRDKLE